MADDRNRREDVDDYSGADPGRQGDPNESFPAGGDDIRGIANEASEEFDDIEDLEDEEEGDDY